MSGDSGWNAVIHHPSELELQNWNWDENDETERELPSTVDMDAIKGGGSWDPATGRNDTDSVDSEEDSDSDEDSSGGTDGSCSYSESESDNESSGDEECADTGSNTDCSSENSEQTFSIRETNFEQGALKLKISMKAQKKEEIDKSKFEKTKKIAARHTKGTNITTKNGECTADDSNSSDAPNASTTQDPAVSAPAPAAPSTQPPSQQQPLQEINQEDLAAILPDQEHEDAPFDGFEDSESGRLVSKAIERMSLGADSDSSEAADANPVPVYSSSLLQQFAEKTALLSEPRKRRSKLVKKSADTEYSCVSNVSPDSGIQSVDNSPLHLATSPTNQLAASQSPVQATKPAVNVDRVLYPPKRKPGRPAKMVSTQPRGPGRPRLRPEVVEKIEKIERNEAPKKVKAEEKTQTSKNPAQNAIVTTSKNPVASRSKRKSKKMVENAEEIEDKSCVEKVKETLELKNEQKKAKTAVTELSKKPKPEKFSSCNTATIVQKTSRRDQTQNQQEEEDKSSNRKSSKENRVLEATAIGKKSLNARKAVQATATPPRRVLKENKSSKKNNPRDLETNVVGVQTVISLPIAASPLKSERIDVEAYKCEKSVQIPANNRPKMHHHHHHHHHNHRHHHKHRRRVVAPPKEPIKINPSVGEELDKLIDEFSRSCSLGKNSSSAVHSELPQIFRVKKMIKKRKGSDVNTSEEQKLKRRLKKEKLPGETKSNHSSSNSNSNEQRLPLKKRHYHVSSPHSSQSSNTSGLEVLNTETNATDNHIEEAIEAAITKYSENISNTSTNVPVTPKKRHRDAEITSVEVAIAESGDSADEKPLNRLEIQPRRKKKIVKDLRVTVTKLNSDSPLAIETNEKGDCLSNEKSLKTHVEKISKSDKLIVAKIDKQPTAKSEKSVIAKSDKTIVSKIDKTIISKIDKTIVSKIDKTIVSKIDKTPASKSDKLLTDKSMKVDKQIPEKTIKPDKTTAEKTIKIDKPSTEKSFKADKTLLDKLVKVAPEKSLKSDKTLSEKATKIDKPTIEKSLKNDKAEKSGKFDKAERLLKNDKMEKSIKSDNTEKPLKIDRSEKSLKTDKSLSLDKSVTEKSVKTDKTSIKVTEKHSETERNGETMRKKTDSDLCDKKPQIAKVPTETNETRTEVISSVKNSVNPIGPTILVKKKIRRRKPINRTGFPTLKKKKKKKLPVEVAGENEDGELKLIRRADVIEKSAVSEMEISDEDKNILVESEIQEILPIIKETPVIEDTNEKSENKVLYLDDCAIVDESSRNVCDNSTHSRPGKLRVRKDLVECDGTRPCDKLCPVKFEKIQDSRMYDENATLEESLERYNQSQRVGELSIENVKKLDRNDSAVKIEVSGCLNNNHKRRRGSTSPCNSVTLRNIKRLKNAGYDTESDVLPSSDVASDETEIGKQLGSSQTKRKQPRWKKRYLQAGLFSDYYKEDEPRRVTNAENPAGKNKMIYDRSEHPHGLLPPPYHCGKFLRQRKIHFQLPYDLWWLHTHSRLPGRDLVPSWNYRKIRTNIYFDVKPTTLYDSQACECKTESGCGDDCINRMVFSECVPQFCPCGEKCENQKIQRHEWAPGLQRFMTDSKGWGIRTKDSIKIGEFILEYVGEVVSEREFKARMATRYANDTHHYCLHLDGGLVIDGHRMGGDGRFVNHSCEPNCEMQKWSVHGLPRMALFASRNIEPGEELTYDYNFALFNPSEGQQCRCGSDVCRGVIGGKSQRVTKPLAIVPSQVDNTERRSVGRPRKNIRKSNVVQPANIKGLCKTRKMGDSTIIHGPSIKPMSHQQRCFAQQHHCFLLRNLEKVRRIKTPTSNAVQTLAGKGKDKVVPASKEKNVTDSKTQSDAFYSQLTALSNVTSRTVRTRRLAQAQDDPEVNKTAKLAKVLKDLHNIVASANDENDQLLCTPFLTLPTKRKLPEYYEKVIDPIDLATIEQCIGTGHYKSAEQFDQDMIKLFDNNVKFFGRTSEFGIAAARLRKLYLGSKADFIEAITEATGSPPAHGFLPPQGLTAGEEDVIRCICGLHRDEGLMIQCERCLVWQHCYCVKADTSAESYLCERCQPREVDLEIPLEGEEEEEGKKQFITLLRGDLQLRQGDTVYVLRDTPEKHTYKTIQKPDYEEMDIFRIERLWKNPEGERFVFGHHYLRPHETYHEPTRKFYENEVVCAPLYEAVPCDLVAERCWVLDPNTYCKGRPVASTPEHTYVCEYRVDRAARLFTKVARARHQVCVKPYAFEVFPERIKHYRTYLPHSLDGIEAGASKASKEKKKSANQETDSNAQSEVSETTKVNGKDQNKTFTNRTRRRSCETNVITTFAVSCVQKEERRKRLNQILLNLLQRMPNKKDPLDLSFLLERNRRNRKRIGNLNP